MLRVYRNPLMPAASGPLLGRQPQEFVDGEAHGLQDLAQRSLIKRSMAGNGKIERVSSLSVDEVVTAASAEVQPCVFATRSTSRGLNPDSRLN